MTSQTNAINQYTIYLFKEGTRQVLVEMNYAHFKRSNFDNETNYIKFLKWFTCTKYKPNVKTIYNLCQNGHIILSVLFRL